MAPPPRSKRAIEEIVLEIGERAGVEKPGGLATEPCMIIDGAYHRDPCVLLDSVGRHVGAGPLLLLPDGALPDLLPWNRSEPLTLGLLWRTITRPPGGEGLLSHRARAAQFATAIAGGCQVPSPGGRTEGGSGFGR